MDKKISKQLRQFASMLPPVYAPCRITLSGEIILEKNEDAKDADGKPVKPDVVYSVPAEVRQNHYRNLKKLYNSRGQEGCFEYAQMMHDFFKGMGEAPVNLMERKESITYGF